MDNEDTRDYEQEAKADGWNPDYAGDNKVDAKTFVEKGEKISGILKSKIGRLEDRIDSLTRSNAEFKNYTDGQISKEQQKNKGLIAELEKTRKEAIDESDGAAFQKADEQINNLRSQEVKPDATAHNQMAQAWAAQNQWYATNPKLSAYADGIAERIQGQGYTGQAYFNELTRQVKETFPDDFSNPNRAKSNGVETGGEKEVSDSKAHTWANLPDDAKAAAKRFEKDIPGFDRKDYVKQYEWE